MTVRQAQTIGSEAQVRRGHGESNRTMRNKIKQNPILPFGFPEGTKPEQVLKKIHSLEGRIAEFITKWSGSVYFVYLHIVVFTLFFIFKPFDTSIFNILLSLEAVFLATFIMVSQNRQALVETYRELEEEQEEQEEEKEQEELEEDVEDIQKDLDEIKNAVSIISSKIESIEKSPVSTTNKNPDLET
ncbi:MAG: hypothetical protein A3A51_01145 [Candidatus Levybacteria bacterium RIFCSPLOWO2_01_FULL_39_10]|nr:MAG: hypothetical protein A3A51_01145 [Candidatus Levybacteria bacterium RIFCSPLOWO2_01_FULL_39_10]